MEKEKFNWTDNPTVSGVASYDTDILNDCLMHLKYNSSGGGGFPLFSAITFDHVLTGDEAVGWALQGSLVTMTYPDAVNRIKELYTGGDETTYRGISCKLSSDKRYIADISQKEAIDDLFFDTGVADFYVLDSANSQFFLPKSKQFVQLTDEVNLLNSYKEAGLPNINGTFMAKSSPTENATGSFTSTYLNAGQSWWSGTDNNSHRVFTLNASHSSSVYGKSNSVQPPSSLKLLYYKVGDTIVNGGEIDVSNLIADIGLLQASKMNSDLSNCNKPFVTETYRNGSSWYRRWSDGWIEQGGRKSGTGGSEKIMLLKKYKDTNYSVSRTNNSGNATQIGFYTCNVSAHKLAVDSFEMYINTPDWAPFTFWEAKGYGE